VEVEKISFERMRRKTEGEWGREDEAHSSRSLMEVLLLRLDELEPFPLSKLFLLLLLLSC